VALLIEPAASISEASGGIGHVAFGFQLIAKQVAQRFVVLDDQQPRLHVRSPSS
jgi:hypothetical protein